MKNLQMGLILCIGFIALKPSLALAVEPDGTVTSSVENTNSSSSADCNPNHYHRPGTYAIDIGCDGITTHKRDFSSFDKLLLPIFLIIGIGRLLYGKRKSED